MPIEPHVLTFTYTARESTHVGIAHVRWVASAAAVIECVCARCPHARSGMPDRTELRELMLSLGVKSYTLVRDGESETYQVDKLEPVAIKTNPLKVLPE